MSYSKPADQTAAVVAALAELGVRAEERVLIMLPDGPGFAEAFAGTIKHGVVPLPVDPLLPAHGIVAVAAEAGAQLVLASADRVSELADLAGRATSTGRWTTRTLGSRAATALKSPTLRRWLPGRRCLRQATRRP